MRHLIIGFATAVALTATATVAGAAVYSPQQQLPSTIVDGFKGNPSGILSQYPNGGAQMISRIRDLAASDPTTLPLIANLLKGTLAPGQQNAIVNGLAQAARLALGTDQQYYNDIQAAVAAAGNKDASDQYAALTGNAPGGTGAGGGGGGAAGGGSGGGGQTTGNGILFGGNNSGNNQTIARNYNTQQTPTQSGSVSGTSNSVSSR